jgi:hypothetical protein
VGGKHKKYVYIKRRDGWYVKVRVLKNRDVSDPEKYIVVGPKVREPPITFEVMREDEIPESVRERLYEV